jgi:hypothetical protein
MSRSPALRVAMLQFRQGEIGIQASGGPRNRSCWCPFMPAPYSKTVVVLGLLVSLFLLSTAPTIAAAPQHAARKRPAKQEQPEPSPPPPPPLPPTLEQMPAVPPQVSFSNGMLTIAAQNSTLSDILRAVRAQTGAAVEIPPNATERVVINLGPGAPRDVLAALLNGSHFNYVMLGSPTNPAKVDRVILTSKAGAIPDTSSASMPPRQNNVAGAPMDEPDAQPVPDSAEAAGEDGPENAASNAPTAGNEEEGEKVGPEGQPQVKTPEQLLRELQLQQQLQQQQQQGAPAPPAPK